MAKVSSLEQAGFLAGDEAVPLVQAGRTRRASMTTVAACVAAKLPAAFKGDPGGNALAVGLFANLRNMNVALGTDLVQTSGHTWRRAGAARYRVGDVGDPPAPETPYSTNTKNGRPVYLAEAYVTFDMFGVAGDAVTDDTTAMQAIFDWSSANQRTVCDDTGGTYLTGPLIWRAWCSIIGCSFRATVMIPRAFTEAEAADPVLSKGHLVLNAGPVLETYMDRIIWDGHDRPNPDQRGWYMQARRDPTPGSYPHGGWWDSETQRVTVRAYGGDSMWLRAGSYGTGDNPNDTSTYDYLRPHQFLRFKQCHFVRGMNNYSLGVLMTGQVAQTHWQHTMIDAGGLGDLLVISPEVADPDGVVRGGANRAGGLLPGGGGGFNNLDDVWLQGGTIGVRLVQTSSLRLRLYCEQIADAILMRDSQVMLESSQFNDAGAQPGHAIVRLDGNCHLSGKGNAGATNGYQVASYGANYVEPGLFYNDGPTFGLTQQVAVSGDGALNVGRRSDAFVNTSLVTTHVLVSDLAWGETITLRAHNGPIVFVEREDGNISIPGGRRLILRSGDTIVFKREDNLKRFWVVGGHRQELVTIDMPTNGYFEPGELVREISTTARALEFNVAGGAGGTVTLSSQVTHWKRLTAGEGHQLGVDWLPLYAITGGFNA